MFVQQISGRPMKPAIIVIGASLGGLMALEELLGDLDAEMNVPIAIVQHRCKNEGENLLAALLQKHTSLVVVEAKDKDELLEGTVFIAPSDFHLLVERGRFKLSESPPVHYARPSVDRLFESAAQSYGSAVLGIVLTGGNTDGAAGSRTIKESGGTVIVQDLDECEDAHMPKATLAATSVDRILKLREIAAHLNTLK